MFVNKIQECKDLEQLVKKNLKGLNIDILHGDKMQYERTTVLNQYKKDGHILIATDVASRGLDINTIKWVINYENPKDIATHIHRIGRTGRAGDKEGVAITLL